MLQELLTQINNLKHQLDSLRPLPPNVVKELERLYKIRFTYESNALEGNTLTQSETELVLERGITIGGKTLAEHLEVIGHRDALDYIQQLATQDEEITSYTIRTIHNLIMRSISPDEAGCYRSQNVKSAGTNYVYPDHVFISEMMHDFINWLNSDEVKSMHPVEYAAKAHLKFVTIHPFRDGNGRTARLLMNLLLIRAGYTIAVISNKNRSIYIDEIVEAQQNSNKEGLKVLIAQAVKDSLIETIGLAS